MSKFGAIVLCVFSICICVTISVGLATGYGDSKEMIEGPQGPQGIQGEQGIQGPPGSQGKRGEPGLPPGMGLSNSQHEEMRRYVNELIQPLRTRIALLEEE